MTFAHFHNKMIRDTEKTELAYPSNYDSAAAVGDELRQFVERYEQLAAEKQEIADQQKEVMAEAKGRGFDASVLRKVIARRKRSKDDLDEEAAVLEMYESAILGVERAAIDSI